MNINGNNANKDTTMKTELKQKCNSKLQFIIEKKQEWSVRSGGARRGKANGGFGTGSHLDFGLFGKHHVSTRVRLATT